MAASVQCRPQDRSLGMVMKEIEGDLATFLEMRKREKERNGLLLIENNDGFDHSAASNPDNSVVSDAIFIETTQTTPADNFFAAVSNKSDYDWLVASPDTPSLPLPELEVQNADSQTSITEALSTAEIFKPENLPDEPSSANTTSAQLITSTSKHSSASRNKRSSLSEGQKPTASRSATPTRKSGLLSASKPSRSSTPTSRGVAASAKPVVPIVRSSTPTRATARSSTPTLSLRSASKSESRSARPTCKASTPSSATSMSAAGRSSSVTKTVPTTVKSLKTSCGTTPPVKSQPKKTAEKAVFSSNTPPNLRMAVPKRPSSASRGRLTASSCLLSSSDSIAGRPRQKSCSPSRGRVNDGAFNHEITIFPKSRGYSNCNDSVNPVLIGTKMVERVVNMRKLAPSKHNNYESQDNSSGKPSLSIGNSGFGRSLSKKSLDMAIRHMDIRGISGNLKTIVTSLPASKSGSTKSRTTSLSDSPLATCSTASSEPSVNNVANVLDGRDIDVNDIGCERESLPPTS